MHFRPFLVSFIPFFRISKPDFKPFNPCLRPHKHKKRGCGKTLPHPLSSIFPIHYLVRSRYSVGTMPVSRLNTLEKYFGSLKPTANATDESDSSVFFSSSQALMILTCLTKSIGVMPNCCLILDRKSVV